LALERFDGVRHRGIQSWCPAPLILLVADWVQNSEKIGNPYYGKEMASCGEIKK